MKAGIIRCMQTEDMCPGTTDFKVMREKKCAFENVEGEIEVIGFNTCGGCPGKRAVTRAAEMVKRGADKIVLALLYYERKSNWFFRPACTSNQRSHCKKKLGESI